MNRVIVIAIHDVAPATLCEARRLRETVRTVCGDAPVSLLTVPRLHGVDGWDDAARAWMRARAAAGDEPVLHGLVHMDTRGRDGAEFPYGMRHRHAAAVVAEGLAVLREVGVHPAGFVAPAYAHPPALERSLRASGLDWWATRGHLRTLRGQRALPSVSLGASTPFRRACSHGAAVVAARLLSAAPAVRVDLHPADLRHPRLPRAAMDLLDTLMRQGRRPVRHGDLVRTVTPRVAEPSIRVT